MALIRSWSAGAGPHSAGEGTVVIETTGTYTDGKGNSFFYRAGAIAPDGLVLADAADTKRGAPENRAEPAVETRDGHEAAAPRKRGGR